MDYDKVRLSERVMEDVREAIVSAYKEHGSMPANPVRACAIMFRECGEAMNEALIMTRYNEPENRTQQLYDELAQVAATAIVIMERLAS